MKWNARNIAEYLKENHRKMACACVRNYTVKKITAGRKLSIRDSSLQFKDIVEKLAAGLENR